MPVTTRPKTTLSRSKLGLLQSLLSFCLVSLCLIPFASPSRADTLTTLYGFDGSYPKAGLIRASDGNLYGTTQNGGADNWGTIFKITTDGAITTLHSFIGYPTDGAAPEAALIRAVDGNLYGTTLGGGASGTGTVFKITTSGEFTTLHSFSATSGSNRTNQDGAFPWASLIQAKDGNLYGTCSVGGANGNGTIFKINTDGTGFTTSYIFSVGGTNADGAKPYAALIQGNDGNFYGTTDVGGPNGGGTVFQFTLTGPDITSLAPYSVAANTGFILTLDGSGFVAGSVVKWNGHALITTFVSDTQLLANVTPSVNKPLALYPAGAKITVTNPDKTTGDAFITITPPAPILTKLAPGSLPAGSRASTLTVTGSLFASQDTVNWNGTALTTHFVSKTTLTATIPAADLTSPGTAQVSVNDPDGGGASQSLTFTINGVPALKLALGTPSRNASGNILIPITLDNTGSGTASSLQITSALLGSSQTTNTLPISLGNVGAGSSAGVTLSYAGSAGTKGQKVKLTVKGSYQAPGSSKSTSYSLSATVTLP